MAARTPANWMAVPPKVLPFRALRFDPARAATDLADLICPPYDVIASDEQADLAARSPYNAVRLELPIGQCRDASTARPRPTWPRGASAACCAPTTGPAYYLSETTFTHAGQEFTRRDLIAALDVEPWSNGAVLPHEHTMPGPKADRLELLRATHLTASPIWLMHRDQPAALAAAWSSAVERAPDVELTWRGEQHRLWLVDDPAQVAAIGDDFARGGPLYIADGHHRYETSLAFRAEAEATLPGARGDDGRADLGRRSRSGRLADPSPAARARSVVFDGGGRDSLVGRAAHRVLPCLGGDPARASRRADAATGQQRSQRARVRSARSGPARSVRAARAARTQATRGPPARPTARRRGSRSTSACCTPCSSTR